MNHIFCQGLTLLSVGSALSPRMSCFGRFVFRFCCVCSHFRAEFSQSFRRIDRGDGQEGGRVERKGGREGRREGQSVEVEYRVFASASGRVRVRLLLCVVPRVRACLF